MDRKLYLRGDAAFASPDIYEYLEDNGILYAIRLKANANLYREIGHLMTSYETPVKILPLYCLSPH